MNDDLPDLSQYLGGDLGPYKSWDKVNPAMIRHWCEAMGEQAPIYTNPQAARTEGFDAVVAPPAMLQAWCMPGFGEQHPPGSESSEPMAVLPLLEAAGYPAVVAVNCEQEYARYLEDGDEIYYRSSIESISDRKTTALGVGFFVTQLCTYYDQRDEVVGTMRFRVLQYRPHDRQDALS